MTYDATITIRDLKSSVHEFVSDRDWHKYHTPKNLSMSIAIEAAELMELFQWRDAWGDSSQDMDQIRDELADVVIYGLCMANALGIDLSTAIEDKMKRNGMKYPVGVSL